MNQLGKVPCTVITGFLGAGKTTLVRHLLANAGGRRLAVIVNEFGDVGVDGALLKGCGDETCPDENIMELANGCLCCTVADDFAPTLDILLSRQPAIDHILIETSGLALPKPLVQAFNWPAIKGRVTVDAVIAVVDGAARADGQVSGDLAALESQRAADPALDHDNPLEEVFGDQIACADLIVLTKDDLLGDAGRSRARANLRQTMPAGVGIIPAIEGQVSPDLLLGLSRATENVIDSRRTHHDGEEDHDHDDFDSIVVTLPPLADAATLSARIEAAARDHGILRVKGHVAVSGKPMRLTVQAVGTRVNSYFDRAWGTAEDRQGRLVAIGLNGFDRDAVAALLAG